MAKQKHRDNQHSTVVEAAGAASASSARGQWTAREIEAVMSQAVTTMMEAGEQDPERIKAAMLDAKQQFIESRRAEASES